MSDQADVSRTELPIPDVKHQGLTTYDAKDPDTTFPPIRDLTDKFIAWTRQQKALLSDKPFFVYFASSSTPAPHHVPNEWIEKYKGTFAHGWDKQREINWVQIDFGDDAKDADHYISPEERLRVAMARQ